MISNALGCAVHNYTELVASKGARVIRWTLSNLSTSSLVFHEDQMNATHPAIVVSDVPFTVETAKTYIAACQRWIKPFQESAIRARAARRRLRQTARAKIEEDCSMRA